MPMLRRAEALIAVSGFEARVFARRIGIRTARIRVVPSGADLPPPSPGVEPGPEIVSLGRLERYKGHRRVVEALPSILARRPAATLRILGAGPDESAIRSLADRLGVADRLTIEAIPGGERQRYADRVAAAACVLVLSEYESQGIAAWEAAALGRPLVVRGSTALGELVERSLAVGVGRDDPAAVIADAVDRAIAQAAASDRPMSVAMPTWDDCARAVRAVYEEALAG
jgi:glycosyltransferase involved in cell wall biosynthesis